jgi:hypothetical protein
MEKKSQERTGTESIHSDGSDNVHLWKVKVKVKVLLCFSFLTEHHVMKGYWGMEIQLHPFLTGNRWR